VIAGLLILCQSPFERRAGFARGEMVIVSAK
jgi:hypothetical protein